jgi:hypothetical protein
MEIPAPLYGLHEGISTEHQPSGTTPYCKNIRPFDIDEERGRTGQRPGFVKAFDTQIGGEHPVIKFCSISTTYIEPE